MRKLLLLCTLVVLLVSGITACQPAAQNGASNQSTPLPPSPTAIRPTNTAVPLPSPTPNPLLQVPAEQLNGLEIHFWHPWSGSLAKALETVTQEFNSTNAWGIQIITTPAGGTQVLVDMMDAAVSEDDLPDVVIASSEQLLSWEEQLAVFTDLNPYITYPQWGFTTEEQADIPQIYWDQDRSSEKQIALPGVRDMHVLFYNLTWAQELGYQQAPETMRDFSSQVCSAAKERKDVDQTGGWIISTDAYTTYSWLTAAGAAGLYDAEANRYQFTSPETQSTLTTLKQLAVNECLWIPRLAEPYDYFAGRQALLYSGSLTDIIPQKRAMDRAASADQWGILPYPSGQADTPVVVNGSSYAITESTPEEQLAAWLFLRFLALPRNQAALTRPTGFLPVSQSAYDELGSFLAEYPQWSASRNWLPMAVVAPVTGSWTVAQHLLEDAAWQIYQPFTAADGIPVMLKQLDEMIPEVLSEQEPK